MQTPSKSPGVDVLRTLYVEQHQSYADIARRYGVTKTSVKRWFQAAGISARNISEATSLATKGKPKPPEHLARLNENLIRARAAKTPESYAKQAEKMRGRTAHNKGQKMPAAQYERLLEQRADPEYRARMSAMFMGEKSPSWKGGQKAEHNRRLDRAEWRRLRLQVYERDGWTCQDCGAKCLNTSDAKAHPKRKIQAHHIVSRRFGGGDELANLVTLCMSCHHRRERLSVGRLFA